MYQKVVGFFKESYQLSPLAFWCEVVETILLVGASAVLTFTVLDPAMWIFVPMYMVGSALGVVSSVIRKAAMVIFLCSWFTLMNVIALITLILNL
jgi:hypothetical protein